VTAPRASDELPARDIVILGGGHNGLVAAAYLARAGLSVTVLERLPAVGGAAVSTSPFKGVDARISRYSYLVSLLPQSIINELGLDVSFAKRRYSSYTPVPLRPAGVAATPGTAFGTGVTHADTEVRASEIPADRGLLIDQADLDATRESFAAIGAAADADLFFEFYKHCRDLTEKLWPTLTQPLLRRSEARALVDADRTWHAMIERPIGEIIERHLQNDVVRGIILTDALIGTFARATDPDLAQNICFLYHLIGQGTGEWNVPVGGMGAITDELLRAAVAAGATVVTGAEVVGVELRDEPADSVEITYHSGDDGAEHTLTASTVLSNVAPVELDRLIASGGQPFKGSAARPEGAQVKVNLLLARLPRLRDPNVTAEQAFGGTFHINETYTQLDTAYLAAATGVLPNPLPCEIYAHSLADPSILSPELQAAGAQTLTVFALHTPHRLVTPATNDAFRAEAQAAVLASLNSVLGEPIEDCLLRDAVGQPCIETKTTLDIDEALRMPGGNSWPGPLSWPFVDDDAPLTTAAERWGVVTAHPRVLLCGSGARRGGAVSGLGGHNAAMAVLEQLAADGVASTTYDPAPAGGGTAGGGDDDAPGGFPSATDPASTTRCPAPTDRHAPEASAYTGGRSATDSSRAPTTKSRASTPGGSPKEDTPS
jgi:phytoene dehydrogenase-like protein